MMSEEEEEILFDRSCLLDVQSDVSVSPVPESPEIKPPADKASKSRIWQTLCLCAAFFGLGLCIAIPGPTLLDLEEQTNTNTEQISCIFTGRSIGYLFGSIVGGFLFDLVNQSCLLSLSLFLTAIGTAAAPWCKSYILLTAIVAFQGVSMGFLDTGGNVLCLYLWGRNSGPFVQAIHFSFGLGAFVAPLIAEPFLSHTNVTNVTFIPNINDTSDASFMFSTVDPDNLRRFVRDVADNSVNTSEALNTTVAPTFHPKKPVAADGTLLSKDKDVTDGTKTSQTLHRTDSKHHPPPPLPPTTTTTSSPHINLVLFHNKSDLLAYQENDTVTSGSSSAAPSTTQTATTTTLPTTTTIPTTTSPASTSQLIADITPTDSNVFSYPTDLNNTTTREEQKPGGTLSKITTHISQAAITVSKVWKSLTKVQFAYFAIAAFVLMVSLVFMCVVCCCSGGCTCRPLTQEVVQPEFAIKKESTGFRVQTLILLFVFYFLYVGMEVTYSSFVMTFSVNYLQWSKSKGTVLTSVFWGSFAAGRGLAIPLSRCLTPSIMLVADLVLSTLSLIGLVIALDSNHTIIWFCSAMLGVGLASVFPTGITWAERYMHITGKTSAIFVVGSALGEMLLPLITGFLFQNKGPMWLLYVMLGCAFISLVLYIIMQNLASNSGERYERLTRNRLSTHMLLSNGSAMLDSQFYSVGSSSEDDEESLELDSMPLINDARPHAKKRVTFNLARTEANGHVLSENNPTKGKSSILKTKGS